MAAPNRMIFGKVPKGGGIFNPKIYVADFGNFKQGFLSMKLILKSNFRVQGMLLFNNCIEKNQNKTHFEEGTYESLHYLAIIPPCIYATISIIKNLQHNFPKMRRGGSKVVWNCSKNSSDLVYFHTNKDLGASYVPLNIYLDDTWDWEGSKKCHKPLS